MKIMKYSAEKNIILILNKSFCWEWTPELRREVFSLPYF